MRRSTIVFGAAAAVGLAVFLLGYEASSPAAAIELDLSRGEVEAEARSYLRARGADPDTFRQTLHFGSDASAAVFLQRVRGLKETSRFSRERLALWNWHARWFRSGEKEEFRLRLGPDGRPLVFEHRLPEAAPGDSLARDSARAVAEAFVREELDVDLSGWRLEDESTKAREQRIDHTFTWERVGSEIEWRPEDPEAGVGSERLSVGVAGSTVGSFRRFLRVPEKFERELSKATSRGTLLSLVSFGLMLLLVIAAAVIGVRRHKDDRVRWRPALLLGGVVLAAVVLAGVLQLPLQMATYPTDMSFTTYLGIVGVVTLIVGVFWALAVWVSGASGESLAEEAYPRGLRGLKDWFAGRWVTERASREVLQGVAVGLGTLGFLTGFYLVGQEFFGVWRPADTPHSQMLSMYLPWLFPLAVSVKAAVSEEAIFRLFGVSVTKRYLKYTVLALLLPAVIWAFAHSTYTVFPVYVRGIELTIVGVAFGWVFIRYGLLTMLMAHYVIDGVLLSMPLLRAGGGSYVTTGVVALLVVALPLAVPLIHHLRGEGEPGTPEPAVP